jgi:hypothetical protein
MNSSQRQKSGERLDIVSARLSWTSACGQHDCPNLDSFVWFSPAIPEVSFPDFATSCATHREFFRNRPQDQALQGLSGARTGERHEQD